MNEIEFLKAISIEWNELDFSLSKRLQYIVNKCIQLNEEDFDSYFGDDLKVFETKHNKIQTHDLYMNSRKKTFAQTYPNPNNSYDLQIFRNLKNRQLIDNEELLPDYISLNKLKNIFVPNEIGRCLQKILDVNFCNKIKINPLNYDEIYNIIVGIMDRLNQNTIVNISINNIIQFIHSIRQNDDQYINSNNELLEKQFIKTFNRLKDQNIINLLKNKFSYMFQINFGPKLLKIIRLDNPFKINSKLSSSLNVNDFNNLQLSNDQIGILINSKFGILSLFSMIFYQSLQQKFKLLNQLSKQIDMSVQILRLLMNGFDNCLIDTICQIIKIDLIVYYESSILKKQQKYQYSLNSELQIASQSEYYKYWIIITDIIIPYKNTIYLEKFNDPIQENLLFSTLSNENSLNSMLIDRFINYRIPYFIQRRYPQIYLHRVDSKLFQKQNYVDLILDQYKTIHKRIPKNHIIENKIHYNKQNNSLKSFCFDKNINQRKLKSFKNFQLKNDKLKCNNYPIPIDNIIKHQYFIINKGFSNLNIKDIQYLQYKSEFSTNYKITQQWYQKIVKFFNFRSKLAKKVNLNQDSQLLKHERRIQINILTQHLNITNDDYDICFYDETSSKDFKKYQMASIDSKSLYFTNKEYTTKQNQTLALCISSTGVVGWTVFFKNNETILNTNFLLDLLMKLATKPKKVILIMDGSPVQSNPYAQTCMHNFIIDNDLSNKIFILQLPRDSSDSNAIERINRIISYKRKYGIFRIFDLKKDMTENDQLKMIQSILDSIDTSQFKLQFLEWILQLILINNFKSLYGDKYGNYI